VTPELAAAIPERRLEGDWLGADEAGNVAVFLGGELGGLPSRVDPSETDDLIATLEAAATTRRELARHAAGYRGLTDRAQEPILDVPQASPARSSPPHELPFPDYPHVVFTEDASALRARVGDLEVRELVARSGFALAVLGLTRELHRALHDEWICAGCWVADRWDDPNPRSPISLARAGLYVYAHFGEGPASPYLRVASPSVPAGLDDVETAVAERAREVTFALRFEDTTAIAASTAPRAPKR
jgi:hypothetical protein